MLLCIIPRIENVGAQISRYLISLHPLALLIQISPKGFPVVGCSPRYRSMLNASIVSSLDTNNTPFAAYLAEALVAVLRSNLQLKPTNRDARPPLLHSV